MTAAQLLTYTTDAGFIGIFVVVAFAAVRHPRRENLYVALFFGVLALAIGIGLLTEAVEGEPPGAITVVTSALVMALPLLLLLLVDSFTPASKTVKRLATAGLAVTVVTLAILPRPFATAYVLVLVAYFVAVAGYATWHCLQAARHAKGVTHRRLLAIATGSGLLALVILLAGFGAALPRTAAIWTSVSSVLSLACGLAYAIGFAPPKPLRRAWQSLELYDFMRTLTALPSTVPLSEAAVVLNQAAASTVGSPNAMMILWDESEQRLTAPGLETVGLLPDDRRNSTVASQSFDRQEPLFVPDATKVDPENADVYRSYGATALLIAPMTIGERRFGVFSAFSERASIFGEDDLALLAVIAVETASFLRRRELAEDAARVRANQEATRLKEEFLTAAAHDLKTPLTVVLGQAQLLQRRMKARPGTPPEDMDRLDLLIHEALRMRRLTEDLLDASRTDRTGFISELLPTDLSALAEEVVAGVDDPRHNIAVEGAGIHAMVDPERIRQVVQNLVDNAIKFSPDGGTITLHLASDGREAQLTVSDSGIGIPEDDLHRIFEPFQRGSRIDPKQFAGTGIGLFLCRRIVEEHGGRIWAENVAGKGSELHVVLPAGTE